MRRMILLVVLCLCATSLFAYNETVSAISFNPSRLGAYTHLKVVKEATIKGGIEAAEEYTEKPVIYIKAANGSEVRVIDTGDGPHGSALRHDYSCSSGTSVANCLASVNAVEKIEAAEGEPGPYKVELTGNTGFLMGVPTSTKNLVPGSYNVENVPPTNVPLVDITLKSGGNLQASKDSYIDKVLCSNNEGSCIDSITATETQLETSPLKVLVDGCTNNSAPCTNSLTINGVKLTQDTFACPNGMAPCRYEFVERNDEGNSHQKFKVLSVVKQ